MIIPSKKVLMFIFLYLYLYGRLYLYLVWHNPWHKELSGTFTDGKLSVPYNNVYTKV